MSDHEAKPEIPEVALNDLVGCARAQGVVRSQEEMDAGLAEGARSASGFTRETVVSRLRESYPRLRALYDVRRIGLFGSFARETADESSDVDLIVEFQRPIGLRFMELVDDLEALLGRKVDVLTPAGLDGIRLPDVARRIAESVFDVSP